MKKIYLITILYVNVALSNNIITISIPKCGTHLLNKCIELLTNKTEISKIPTIKKDLHPTILSQASIDAIKDQPMYISKHLLYSAENLLLLKQNECKAIFIFRDPRDKIISWINFVYNYAGPKKWWPSIYRHN